MPRSRAIISALTMLTFCAQARFEQAGGERGGDELGAATGGVAAIGELGTLDRPLRHLCLQEPKPAGEIDVQFYLVKLGPIDGGHVDGELDGPLGQVIDQELGGFERDRSLRLSVVDAPEVRRYHDVGQLEQRMIGRRRRSAT